MAKNRWTSVDLERDYPPRWATPESVEEGKRLFHAPKKIWFEYWVLTPDNKYAVGFTSDGKEYYALLSECYHEWDPKIDKRKPQHA